MIERVSHDMLQRDFGRMEGKQDEMGARLDRLERLVTDGFEKIEGKIDDVVGGLSRRVAKLETDKAKVGGAFRVAHALWSLFLGALGFIAAKVL